MKLFDLDKLVNTLTGYIETRIELLKIDAREGLAVAITKIVQITLLAFLGFFILFFVFLGLAALLNEALESMYWGYFIAAGFFALLLGGVLLLSDHMKIRIRRLVVEAQEEILEEENELEDV